MKIDNSLKLNTVPPSGPARPRQDTENAAAAASDGVKLSALAEQFHAADSKPPFDSKRVEQIKQAIAEGRFSIDADAIADRLIDSARDLVNAQRRA